MTISGLTAELAKASETKEQLELDYGNKCQAFQSLSAQYLAEKVSFEVSRRYLTYLPGDALHASAVYAKTIPSECPSVTLVICQKKNKKTAKYVVHNFLHRLLL